VTDHRSNEDKAPVKSATAARQGAKGTNVLLVLLGGLALAVLALLYFVNTEIERPPAASVNSPNTPSTDAVPNNAEPSRMDSPPSPNK
jgi:hypothetical protein